jgi:DHA3 family tetracycline resistance protein-like MFS transporter
MLVSLIGDGIYLVAVPFAVLALGGGAQELAFVGLAWSLGMVGFLLLGGLLADRHDKRRQLLGADALQLLPLALAGALQLSGALHVWHLVVLSFVLGAGEGLAGPALNVVVPDLVPPELLLQANALQQSLRPVALRFAGPALGGAAVALLHTGGALLLDAGTFAVSIACLLAMRARPPVRAEGETGPPLLAQLREGFAYVRGQVWLWATMLMGALALLAFFGPSEVLLPIRVSHDLGGTAGDFGVILAAEGVASVLATLVVGHLGMPRREITVLYWLWAVAGFALCAYAVADAVWQLVAAAFLFGIFSGAGNPIWATLMQTRVPPELRGRVASLDWLLTIGLTPVSFAITGPLAAAFGATAVLLWAGVLAGGVTAVMLYVTPGLRAEDGGLARAEAGAEAAQPSSEAMSAANAG